MPRGGKRKGAGRPATLDARVSVAVRLSQAEAYKLDALRGSRTRSDEVRRLIRSAPPTRIQPPA
jgi:hypothetical protein